MTDAQGARRIRRCIAPVRPRFEDREAYMVLRQPVWVTFRDTLRRACEGREVMTERERYG